MRQSDSLLTRLRTVARARRIALPESNDGLRVFLRELVALVGSASGTWEQKAAVVGRNPGRLQADFNKALKSADYSAVERIAPTALLDLARVVGMPLVPVMSRVWERVDWWQADEREAFRQMSQDAREVVTLHDRVDGWVMPEAMFRWWFTGALTATGHVGDGLTEALSTHLVHRWRSRVAREHSSCRSRVLANPWTFRRAAAQPGGRDWLADVASEIRCWDGGFALTVPDAGRWLAASRTVERLLGRTGF